MSRERELSGGAVGKEPVGRPSSDHDANDARHADATDGMTERRGAHEADGVARAAHRAAVHARRAREDPEPSLARRLGQIGILGWTIVLPTLLGLAGGRWLDRVAGTGVFFSAPLLMIGAAIGLWSAWKWMHRQGTRK